MGSGYVVYIQRFGFENLGYGIWGKGTRSGTFAPVVLEFVLAGMSMSLGREEGGEKR